MNCDEPLSRVQYSTKVSRGAPAPQTTQPNPASRRTELVHARPAHYPSLLQLQPKTLARKSAESQPRPPLPQNRNRTETPGIPVLPIKSPHLLPPSWDNDPPDALPPVASIGAGTKRAAAAAGLNFAKRVSVARSTVTQPRSAIRDLPRRPSAFLDPGLGGIRRAGEPVVAPRNPPVRTAKVARPQKPQMPQIGIKAARKRESTLHPIGSSSSDSSSDSDGTPSQSESEDEISGGRSGDVEMEDAAVGDARQTITPSVDVSLDALVRALEPLALTSVRLRKARRLPFLLRNVRVGFRSRCKALGIKTAPDPQGNPRKVTVTYEIARTGSHSVVMDGWYCPLCELHGLFKSVEALGCHLNWDHRKVDGIDWEVLGVGEAPRLRIALPTSQRTEVQFNMRSLTEPPPPVRRPTDAVSSHLDPPPRPKAAITNIITPFVPPG
ncbi:hypothetical protein BD779DRAFT_1550323 [Infundibulicybe gibba]|nr:hypothetical protein BD779DRAFT_1550323 [Infundibulicybe gibba]